MGTVLAKYPESRNNSEFLKKSKEKSEFKKLHCAISPFLKSCAIPVQDFNTDPLRPKISVHRLQSTRQCKSTMKF